MPVVLKWTKTANQENVNNETIYALSSLFPIFKNFLLTLNIFEYFALLLGKF